MSTATPEVGDRADSLDAPGALHLALQQSEDVKAKVEACAADLASANDIVKQQISDGTTTLSAHETLMASALVEGQVQECADDLHEVTESLALGIDDLRQTELALNQSQKALADSEAALGVSQAEERRLRRRALHDSLTGLPNRDLFDDRLAQAISLAERHGWTLAVMFVDLDGFKRINDTHGHSAGDLVLKEVARRLMLQIRDEDTVCRNGGDEFLYLLMNPQGLDNVRRIAGLVARNIAQPVDFGASKLVVGASIGIAMYPARGATGDRLIEAADAAMYLAKKLDTCCVLSDVDAMGTTGAAP